MTLVDSSDVPTPEPPSEDRTMLDWLHATRSALFYDDGQWSVAASLYYLAPKVSAATPRAAIAAARAKSDGNRRPDV